MHYIDMDAGCGGSELSESDTLILQSVQVLTEHMKVLSDETKSLAREGLTLGGELERMATQVDQNLASPSHTPSPVCYLEGQKALCKFSCNADCVVHQRTKPAVVHQASQVGRYSFAIRKTLIS